MITVLGLDGTPPPDAAALLTRMFAAAGLPWEDALIVSAWQDGLRRAVNACRAHPKVAVLTPPGAGPAELARELAPSAPRAFVVGENLGTPEERITRCRPAEATTRTWHDPAVVLVLDPRHTAAPRDAPAPEGRTWIAGARPGPARWALDDPGFGADPVVRAYVLARLGPRVGDLVWDIGAGGGAVAIECARFGAAAIAVERDEESCARVRANVRAYGVKVQVARGTAPHVLDFLPDPDAVFVGGGDPAAVAACARRALRAVVVQVTTAERVPPALDALTAADLVTETVRLPGAVHVIAAVRFRANSQEYSPAAGTLNQVADRRTPTRSTEERC